MKDMIKRFVDAFGPSGYEDQVRGIIAEDAKKYADEIRVDALGNLIAVKKGDGTGKRVMIAGHMDEIGIIVTHIDDNGFLRFSNVGGMSAHVILGQRVVFENGTLGIVCLEKIDDLKELRIDKLFIDIGMTDKKSAAAKVSVGDMAGFYHPMQDLGQRIIAKSLDDRIACAIMVEAMKRLKKTPHECYFVFTVQEEVGTRGARTGAYALNPDIGISLDVSPAGDIPKEDRYTLSLGKGAAVKVKDASMISHPAIKKLMIDTAKKHGIPYQLEVLGAGGTDSGAIHTTREGVPSGVISIPSRYTHSQSEMVDMGDVEACTDLLVKILEAPIEI